MNDTTYNLDFTITHTDSLLFQVDATTRATAIETAMEMIHNQMEDFGGTYDVELNSCTEEPPAYVPFQSQNTSQGYVSLAQHYSTSTPVVETETSVAPSLPPIPGYSRFAN